MFDQAEVATIDIAALNSQLSDSSDASDDVAEVAAITIPKLVDAKGKFSRWVSTVSVPVALAEVSCLVIAIFMILL